MTSWKLFWTAIGGIVTVAVAALLHLVTLPAPTATPITTPTWLAVGAVLGAAAGGIALRTPLAAALGAAAGIAGAAALGFMAGTAIGVAPIAIGVMVGAVIVLAVIKITEFAMLGATVLKGVDADVIGDYSRGIGLATALHLAWVGAARLADIGLVTLAATLIGLVLLDYWGAVIWEYLQGRRPPKEHRHVPHCEQLLAAALAKADLRQLKVVDSEPIGYNNNTGRPDGVRYTLLLDTGKREPANDTGERTAVALREILKKPLNSDWVQFRKAPGAGEYTLDVTERDTKADIIPYVDSVEPISITEPCLIGYDHDTPVTAPLNTNGQNIGQFGSGKSSLTNVQLAHLTRCVGGDDIGPGAVVWICGVEKLYELVGEWVEPYFDTDYDLPFDWIANGQHDTVTMLVTAMNIARWRQRQPIKDRIDWPYIIVVLDEAGFAFRDTTVTAQYQGQWVNASQAAANLTMGARSGNVHLIRNSQRSTLDHGGPGGGDISANMGWTAAFRSKDDAEIGRLTGDFTLKMPRHKGEFWFDPGTSEPILLKAPYIQETSRNRPRLHDGATIRDVSWARRHLTMSLDPGSAAIGGEAYARRHTRMNDAMRAYLTGDPTIGQPDAPQWAVPAAGHPAGLSGGNTSAYDVGHQMMMQMLAEMFPDVTPPEIAAPPPAPSVVTMVGRRTRPERIAEILNASDEPMSYEDLVAELRKTEDPPIPDTGLRRYKTVVSNALGQMVEEERIQRLERGMYSKAS